MKPVTQIFALSWKIFEDLKDKTINLSEYKKLISSGKVLTNLKKQY